MYTKMSRVKSGRTPAEIKKVLLYFKLNGMRRKFRCYHQTCELLESILQFFMGFQVAGLAVATVVCFSLKAFLVVISDLIVSASICLIK